MWCNLAGNPGRPSEWRFAGHEDPGQEGACPKFHDPQTSIVVMGSFAPCEATAGSDFDSHAPSRRGIGTGPTSRSRKRSSVRCKN